MAGGKEGVCTRKSPPPPKPPRLSMMYSFSRSNLWELLRLKKSACFMSGGRGTGSLMACTWRMIVLESNAIAIIIPPIENYILSDAT